MKRTEFRSGDRPDWTRRDVLRTFAAAASLPALAGGAPLRRLGIVGGGMAGVALAWLVDGIRDVVLFEARDTIGGNVQSIEVELNGKLYVVDVGAQYFHPGPYPTYTQLLTVLGLYPPATGESHSFATSITVDEPSEATPRFISPVLPARVWPLAAPWNISGLRAFAVCFRAAKIRENLGASWALTLGDWLPELGLSREQWEGMLLPWAASLYSGDSEQARGISARSAMIFAAKALPENPTEPVIYYVLNRGMIEPLRRMCAELTTAQVFTRTQVERVERNPQGGFVIHYGSGRRTFVDDLVFASSGPPTLQLLASVPGASAQRAALQGIEFHDARLMIHSDPAYARPNPIYRSFLNCQIDGSFCEASMSLAGVVTDPPQVDGPDIWKSWVTHRRVLPSEVLHEVKYRHMLPTPASILSQNVLRSLQGQSGLWFAGGYTMPFDSQETALLSALRVAQGMGTATPRMMVLEAAGSAEKR